MGPVTESVTVDANAVRVQTTDASIARSVSMRDLDSLPQLLRSPLSLANFLPGVVFTPSTSGANVSMVNGTRQGANNTLLDGVDVNDPIVPFLHGVTLGTNTDSVEEFRIITNGAKAEYGRNAGGQIDDHPLRHQRLPWQSL